MPQLARSRVELPRGDGWSYEPKWDGFRALAFVDGSDYYLQSRNGKPLGRYFPELEFPKGRYVLDGELVILDADGKQEFNALQQRIHPAASRIERLSKEMPAHFVAFDVLSRDDQSLLEEPFERRRAELEKLVAKPVELTPTTTDRGGGGAVAAGRRGRDRQAARRSLPPRRADRDGEDQTRAHDRQRGRGLAPGKGRGHAGLADPRAVRQGGRASCGRPHLGVPCEGEARATGQAGAL